MCPSRVLSQIEVIRRVAVCACMLRRIGAERGDRTASDGPVREVDSGYVLPLQRIGFCADAEL
jgi:hypothetical protein